MQVSTSAIICAMRAHGEHGAIVRALTPDHGLLAGYVRGGRSRRLRPVLVPGNLVEADFRARTAEQLPGLTVELSHSRAGLLAEPLAAAAIDWLSGLTATALAEGQPHPRLYEALEAVLAAIEYAPSARGWAAAAVRYELLLLAELGYALDLSACAATGTRDDLAFVSPKTGAAVSRVAGEPYAARLLRLPVFLLDPSAETGWPDILDAMRLTGHFLARDLLVDRRADMLDARERLIERIRRLG
ncbi:MULTISPECIES: DNA repair protein RecO [unclassified Sphingomonas]|uniref:DNA repair protein RecO n=1 Tax=unclassified Sphingomonas TaxID=196159 RepID=UPI0006FBA2E5|nr:MULTISPECIES: DNA repair protein RecO [unclassified Sphingomonas]KQX18054.1 DNA repair protein RecO [Sphingomonas sp. Root1294]KQY72609.1 DNA repair protein RecO [Sphingomonas sp. Root50]KRB87767.1 DNA repair protein RecO [Sphingomonas sp. Root720]